MRFWPDPLETEEVIWIRQEARRLAGSHGIYDYLAEVLNIERGMKCRRLTTKKAVYAAAVGISFKELDVPPVETNPHLRPNKLTRKQVREIVRLLDQRDPIIPTGVIAKQYGVSQVAISKINTRSNHGWATKGQSTERRSRHRQVLLSMEDRLCLLSCAALPGWWRRDVLAEIFGLTSANCVSHRLRSARRTQERKRRAKGSMMSVTVNAA